MQNCGRVGASEIVGGLMPNCECANAKLWLVCCAAASIPVLTSAKCVHANMKMQVHPFKSCRQYMCEATSAFV